MFFTILYFLFIFFELLFAFFIFIFALSALYSSFMGSAYIPTKNKEIELILKEAPLKRGQIFMDLGCGDGRVVKMAVRKYGVRGIGIDINPVLIFLVNLNIKLKGLKNIEFKTQSVFTTDLKRADFIYLFLMPKLLERLMPKLEQGTKKGVVIISHGFKIIGWEKYNFKTIRHLPFPTYFYKI